MSPDGCWETSGDWVRSLAADGGVAESSHFEL